MRGKKNKRPAEWRVKVRRLDRRSAVCTLAVAAAVAVAVSTAAVGVANNEMRETSERPRRCAPHRVARARCSLWSSSSPPPPPPLFSLPQQQPHNTRSTCARASCRPDGIIAGAAAAACRRSPPQSNLATNYTRVRERERRTLDLQWCSSTCAHNFFFCFKPPFAGAQHA